MTLEECPFCGKPFKRLKSHLHHCKMAPVSQPQKTPRTLQDLPEKTAVKTKVHKNITEKDDAVFNKRPTSVNIRKVDKLITDKKSNATISDLTTQVTSLVSNGGPKSKWSAKRQKENERLKQLPISQKSNKSTSLSDCEIDQNIREMSNGQEQRASQTNGKTTKGKKKLKVTPVSEHLSITKNTTTAFQTSSSLLSEWSLYHETPKLMRKYNVMKEIEPKSQRSDLVSRLKELKALPLFASKTSVWDHIKGSLYYKTTCNLLLPRPVLDKASAFETKYISPIIQQSNKLETIEVLSAPSNHFPKTSVPQHVEDVKSSRLKSFRSLEWNPEIMASFRFLFLSEHFRNSSIDNTWKKRQFSCQSNYSEVPVIQQNIADVRLKDLGVWLGAQSSKSPRELGFVLKQGWQWYYTKYINVRRGGIGGISLLLAGYCVLCYIWRYPHLKTERWRKYH